MSEKAFSLYQHPNKICPFFNFPYTRLGGTLFKTQTPTFIHVSSEHLDVRNFGASISNIKYQKKPFYKKKIKKLIPKKNQKKMPGISTFLGRGFVGGVVAGPINLTIPPLPVCARCTRYGEGGYL